MTKKREQPKPAPIQEVEDSSATIAWEGARSTLLATMALWLASLLFTFVVYYKFLSLGYLADDFGHFGRVTRTPVWHFWFQGWYGGASFFRPAARTIYTLQYHLLPGPGAQHALSLVVHATVAALAARAAWLLVRSPVAAVGALVLFLTKAAHAEPVAWLSAQADLWTALCALAALNFILGESPVRARAAGAALCFLAALAFKEAPLFLLPLLMGIAWWRDAPGPEEANRGPRWAVPAAIAAAGALYLIWRLFSVGFQTSYPATAPEPWSFGHFAGNTAQLLRQTLGLLRPLALDSETVRDSPPATIAQLLILAALLAPGVVLALRGAPGRRPLATLAALGAAWIVFSIAVPALGSRHYLFPSDQQSHDRLVYLATIGWTWLCASVFVLGWNLGDAATAASRSMRRRVRGATMILLAASLAYGWPSLRDHQEPWPAAQALSDAVVEQLAAALPRDEPKLLVATLGFPAELSVREGGPEALGVRSVGEALWIAWGRRPEQTVATLHIGPEHRGKSLADIPAAEGARVIALLYDGGTIHRMTWEEMQASWEAQAGSEN